MPSPDPPILRRSPLGRRAWLGLAATALIGVAVSVGLQRLPPPRIRLDATPVFRTVLEDPGSPRVGAPAPQVTIVVFTDYQCAICRRTDGALARLLARDPGVMVIYKDWPIFGEASREAAKVALASRRQGRYAAVHQALMSTRGALTAERIRGAAVSAGVDWPRLLRDRADNTSSIDAQLGRHSVQAFSLGLEGTPGYLVGPYLVRGGLDDRALARTVEAARRGRASPPY
jgi:protein-disulfide isomerase